MTNRYMITNEALLRAGSHHPVTRRVTPLLGQEGKKHISPLLFKEGWREAPGWLLPSA